MEPYLMPEIRAHDGDVVFGETSYQFMLKVIAGSRNCIPVTLLVRAAAFLNRFFQTIVKIFVFPAFRDLRLIIKFDFVHQQAREALRFAMYVLVLR